MARIVVFNILMFLLPFVVYGAYLFLRRQSQDEETIWAEMPWGWLFGAGMLMMALGLGLVIHFTGSPPGGTYHPPRFEDGVIKPGRIE